jgi:type IV pilus assembly protein PilE
VRVGRPAVANATLQPGRNARRGFTLIELVVVVGIVAILATVAVASYSAYIVRSKRAAAKAALLQDAQFMERNYTVAGCYSNTQQNCTGAATVLPLLVAPQEGTASYNIAFQGPLTAATYTLAATPTGGFSDPDCGVLTLDNTGTKGQTAPGTAATCWQR